MQRAIEMTFSSFAWPDIIFFHTATSEAAEINETADRMEKLIETLAHKKRSREKTGVKNPALSQPSFLNPMSGSADGRVGLPLPFLRRLPFTR